MTAGIIMTICFFAVSVILLILAFVLVKEKPLSTYIRVSCAIYISGELITLILALLRRSLPMLFFLLCNLLVTTVFLFSTGMLIWANKKFSVKR
ncbi:MAG: hypothetical protein J5379_04685 [Clostridiales bacterium]|nr:hypothetical protein [Clostridiales bacterium]